MNRPFVRAIVSTAVAVAVALHSVLGCCWHHAHETVHVATEVGLPGAPVESATHCLCRPHEVEVAETAEEHSDRRDSDHSCPTPCGDKCRDVVISRAQPDDAAFLATSDLVPAVDQPILNPVLIATHFQSAAVKVDPPPLRLHLLHQLLLI